MKVIEMKAVGSADQLTLVDRPDPQAGFGQVVIDVEAIGVGLVDVLQRQGYLGPVAAGHILGLEAAGRVAAVGAGVNEDLVGKRVYARGQGAYAEQFVAPADTLALLPDQVSSDAAVGLGINALVAWFSILKTGLHADETVLVRGASGGVGAMAAQMAVTRGAMVTAVTNAEAAHDVAALGVKNILRRGLDTEPQGPFDVIIDPVAGDAVPSLIRTLAPNGRYLINGAAAGMPPPSTAEELTRAFSSSPTYSLLSLDSVAGADLLYATDQIFAWAARGDLRAYVAQSFPLRDAAEAHKMLESGVRFGKVVLNP